MNEDIDETEDFVPLVTSDIFPDARAIRRSPGTEYNFQAAAGLDNIFEADESGIIDNQAAATMPRLTSEELNDAVSFTSVDTTAQRPDAYLDLSSDAVSQTHGDENQSVKEDEEAEATEALESEIDNEEAVEEEMPVPKKRGRPPKKGVGRRSAKQDKSPTHETSNSSTTPVPDEETPSKPPRRSAKKGEKDAPAKAPMAMRRQTRASTGATPTKRQQNDKATVAPAPALKRRRGRPPKPTTPASSEATKSKATRGTRGRKRGRAADPSNEESVDETEYIVESIVESVIESDGIHYYQVKWKGYPHSENTWEPKRNLANCRELIAEFEQGDKKSRKRVKKE